MPPKPARASASGVPKSKKAKAKPKSGSEKAGTLFPVGRLARMLRQGRHAERTSVGAGAFLAGALEYICAEILELAGDVCD